MSEKQRLANLAKDSPYHVIRASRDKETGVIYWAVLCHDGRLILDRASENTARMVADILSLEWARWQ